MNFFSKKLSKILLIKKMHQTELAYGAKIPEATISKYLSGRSSPTYERIVSISEYLKVPPFVFFKHSKMSYAFAGITNAVYSLGSFHIHVIYKEPKSHVAIFEIFSVKDHSIPLCYIIPDDDKFSAGISVLEGSLILAWGDKSSKYPQGSVVRIIPLYRNATMLFTKDSRVLIIMNHNYSRFLNYIMSIVSGRRLES